MAKQLNVNLAFSADTSRVKTQMQDLQKSLDNLITSVSKNSGEFSLTKDLIKAQGAAVDLKIALQQATTSTGSLDLSKFNSSLQKSGMTLEQYRNKLSQLGPAGTEAFLKLSNSIISAEAPLKRVNTTLEQFKTTLANTTRWQISSSILHGFMGTLQSAYRYAQDLNESLTNIRIVTGQTTDQMAAFADKANKAAQALSTSTTAYTDAALIFYQQGLDDNAVEARTEATIKMAHATGDSAKEVSSYMTAIWNNFDDGSESMEHYADVITALGASTASSSSEIASGLQQFASIAKTTGLSYDYATSALATLVANTRQSADTIGNSLKTIFSRLQGLKMGETLDDGLDLNKYSKALKAIGVDVLDVNGNMMEMDNVLEETAAKWDNMTQSQKMAFAQTVAGTRQYNQLMSLMDNWDDMQANLNTASKADGTLDEQAKIYAESWEAARDRVKAAAQAIYNDLLNDKFFISLNNMFANILQGIDSFIDGIGGLRTVLPSVFVLITKIFGDSMAKNIDNLIFNVQRYSQSYQQLQQQMRETAYNEAMKINADTGTNVGDQKTNSLKIQLDLSKELQNAAKDLDDASIKELQTRMDIVKEYRNQVEAMAEVKDKATEKTQDNRINLLRQANKATDGLGFKEDEKGKVTYAKDALKSLQQMETASIKAQKQFDKLNAEFLKDGDLKKYAAGLTKIKSDLNNVGFDKNSRAIKTLNESFDAAAISTDKLKEKISILSSEGGLATDMLMDIDASAQEYANMFGWAEEETEAFRQSVREMAIAGMDMDQAIETAGAAIQDFHERLERAKGALNQLGTTGQTIVQTFQGINQVTMGLSSAWNIVETLTNPDISGLEKMKTVLMSLPMAITGLISGLNQLKSVYQNVNSVLAIYNTLSAQEQLAAKQNLLVKAALWVQETLFTLALKLEAAAQEKGVIATLAHVAANIALEASLVPIPVIVIAITAAIATLVLIIWGIVKAFKAWEASTPEGKLAAAKEQAKALGDQLDNVKSSVEELKSAFDQYTSAVQTLENCTKGTQEWYQALQDVNTQVIDLLNSYPELAQYVTRTSDGMLQISDEGQEAMLDIMNTRVLNSQAAFNEANQNARLADINVKERSVSKAIGIGSYDLSDSTVGKTLEEVVKKFGSEFTNEEMRSALEESLVGLDASSASIDSWVNTIDENRDAIREWQSAIEENTNATELENEAMAAMALADNKAVQNSKYKDQIIEASGRNLDIAIDKQQKQLEEDGWGISQVTGVNDEAKKVFSEYMKAADKQGATLTNTTGSGNNRKFIYEDIEGEEHEVDLETMRTAVAAARAVEDLGSSAETLVKKFAELGSSSDLADHALMDFIGGDLNKASKDDFEALSGKFGGETIESKDDAMSYLEQVLGEDFDPLAYGYKTADEMANAFMEEYNNAMAAWDSIELPEGMDDWAQDMSLNSAQAIENTLKEINIGPMGEKAGEDFVNALNTVLKDVDPEKQQEALDALMSIDWTSYDALDQAKEMMKEFGVEIDLDSEYWREFAANMRLAAGSQPDFSSIKSDLIEISTLLNGLEFGKAIKDEDYKKLVDYNAEWKKFFILQADGTRQFISDSEQMLQATREEINTRREELAMHREAAEALEKWGHTDDTGNFVQADWNKYAEEAKDGGARGTAENLINAGGAVEKLLTSLGYTDEVIQEILNDTEHGSERLAEMFNRMNEETNPATLNALNTDLNEMMASTASNLAELNHLYEQGDVDIDSYNKRVTELATNIATNASTLEELRTGLGELGGSTDVSDTNHYDEYAQGLLNIASKYESCSEAAERYQNALNALAFATDNNREAIEKQVRAAQDNLEALIGCEEAAKKYGLETDTLTAHMNEIADAEGVSKKEALELAVANERMNRGVATLVNNWKDWKKTLKSADKTAEDYAATLADVSDAVQELVGWYDDLSLNSEFVEENMDLIDKAAKGDVTAILELGTAVASYEVAQAELNTTLAEGQMEDGTLNALQQYAALLGEGTTAAQAFASAQSGIQAGFDAIRNNLDALQNNTVSLADVLGGEQGLQDWVNQLNAYAAATGMTAEQMQQMLSSVGVTANVQSDYQEQEITVPTYTDQVTDLYYEKFPVTKFDPVTGESFSAYDSVPIYTRGSVPGPPLTTTGFVEVASISMDGAGEAPKVSPPTFTGKQAPSNTAKRGGTGNSPGRRGGGGGRRGGGGGRRGDRPKERQNKDTKKHREIEGDLKVYDKEIERYHEIEKSIDNIQEKLDKYENIADRAFGKAKVKALKDSAKAYKDLAKAYNTELKENQDWLSKDIAKARDYGWKLDENGNVSNYEENMKKLVKAQNAAEEKYLKKYNKAVTWFNKLSGDEQAKEGNQKKFENLTKKAEEDLEDANKLYEDSVEALKQVEESQEKREEIIKQQREALQKALDAEVEAVDVTVQVRLDISDSDLKLLKEILEQIGDSADKAADAIGVIGQEVGDLEAKAKTARKGIADILAVYTKKDLLGDNALNQSLIDKIIDGGELTADDKEDLLAAGITEDTISKLESYGDELLDVNSALRDLRDEALQKTSDAFNEFVENLDRSSEKIQHLQKVSETYKNIIGIVGKKVIDASGELTKQLGKANFEMQRNNTHALKSELDFIDQSIQNQKDAIARLMSDNANGQHDEAIKQMNQQLKDMEDQRDSTYESWLDSWQAELQDAADIYAETLESIVENFSDSLAGALGSLDDLAEEFSRKKEIQDLYLDDYRQIYELSKLTRDINKSIDDTDNIKSKQALKSLMEDIEQMQENGVKLSEYDLENLQRQYELELAKQQLKESQEAKSEVRMTRDSEGNYGYVYTADSNAVAEAEQNYEDKLYAMQKANADYIEELQNNIISAEQACADALAELDASQFASYEEYQEAVARVQADYSELIEGYYQQIGKVLDNNRNLYQTEWTEYSVMTGYKISADKDYVDSFNETRLSILTGYGDIETAQDAWNKAIAAATNEAALAYEEWYRTTQIALDDGKTSMQDFGKTVDEVTEEVLLQAKQMEDSASTMASSYKDAYGDILIALSDFCIKYDSKIQDIVNSNTGLVNSINSVIKAAADLDEDNESDNSGSEGDSDSKAPSNNSGSSKNNKSSKKKKSNSKKKSGKKKKNTKKKSSGKPSWSKGYAAYKRINAGAWGDGISHRISMGAKEGFSKAEVQLGQKIINYTYSRDDNGLGYSMKKAKELLGYDTGGYTGNWNSSDGKLALLHKKELVLNKDDTENMLKAVEVIREINKTIDLNALSASSGFASLLSSLSMVNDNNQEIQQNVSIEASFPGVTERGEIEEAFNNLINRAAQFVNRKK